MIKNKDIFDTMFAFAPPEGTLDYDNVGLLAGDSTAEVTRVLVALDITLDTISEAKDIGAQLIVAHHPVIFDAVKAVTDETYTGKRLLALINNNIAAICMHTNLDAAPSGVNEALALKCGLQRPFTLPEVDSGTYPDGTKFAICRAGYLERPTPIAEYLAFLKNALGCNGLRYSDAGKPVHHVAVIGGSGASELDIIIKYGCDTFVTADISHNKFLQARDAGINLIDAGHFSTENTVVPVVAEMLREKYPEIDVRISQRCGLSSEFFV